VVAGPVGLRGGAHLLPGRWAGRLWPGCWHITSTWSGVVRASMYSESAAGQVTALRPTEWPRAWVLRRSQAATPTAGVAGALYSGRPTG
jgi:hypothetical protein